MKKVGLILILLLASVIITKAQEEPITMYFFYSNGCPHCAKEKPFLENLQQKYPDLNIKYYEISDPESVAVFKEIAESYGTSAQWVPATFLCDYYKVGFDSEETTGKEIEDKVKNCLEFGCTDLSQNTTEQCLPEQKNVVQIPLLGEIDLTKVGLPVLTVVLGFLDGFNPCAIWVLCFLLTLLIYAKSRKKMLLIGSIFVLTSGIVYFFFMAAWLNFFLMIGFVKALRIIVALVAIIAGLINAKDFFFFKKGASLTIPDSWKPKLFARMRNLVKEQTMFAIIIGTIVLAFTANTFELICTFGFPAIYTRALTLQNLPALGYYLYLALYNVVYVLPLAVIVVAFTWTMGAHRFTEKQGKILKLISGLLMLILGLILLFKPDLLIFG
jgi:thiol-disulfide isomerase/thioredoxin